MQRVAHSPVLTHSHSPRSASCSKSGRTRTKTRARAVELRSSAGPVVAACLVRQDATPVLYSFPLAMRRSLVSLDSQAPEVGAGAAGDGMIFSASMLSGCIVSACIMRFKTRRSLGGGGEKKRNLLDSPAPCNV